jgi:ABC-2 type transport system ATP-binding protein
VSGAIEIDGLVKRYGGRAVVDGVSLRVDAGEIVALLGPNGAGKTTTVEIVEGYRGADGGTVRVLGIDPATGGRTLRARVGLMLQAGGIDMRARPLESLRQYARFHADPRDPDELLDLVGLRSVATTRYRRLSGGERQRLGLALALVGRPEVAILDEPTAGMDPEGRAVTRRIVAGLRDEGVAVLLTSHDLADVERLADRICIIAAGAVVATGTPAELAAGLRPRLRARFDRPLSSAEAAELGRALETPVAVLVDEDWIRFGDLTPTPDAIAAVAAWAARAGRLIVELRTTGGSLEDAYLELVWAGTLDGAGPLDGARADA